MKGVSLNCCSNIVEPFFYEQVNVTFLCGTFCLLINWKPRASLKFRHLSNRVKSARQQWPSTIRESLPRPQASILKLLVVRSVLWDFFPPKLAPFLLTLSTPGVEAACVKVL